LVIGVSLARNRQLGTRYFADEWFSLGVNLRVWSTLGVEREPTVLRPPGYPAFVAAVLLPLGVPQEDPSPRMFPWSSDLAGFTIPFDPRYLERAAFAVYCAQAVVLAASAATLFLWLAGFLSVRSAFLAALLYGTNPYIVILAGVLSYAAVHLFCLVLSCFLLFRALAMTGRPRTAWLLLAGACFGVTALVRPTTLILPPFLFGALLVKERPSVGTALRSTLVFSFAMGLVLVPWTVRNYRLTQRLIPVSGQAWASVWASTAVRLDRAPNYFRWKEVLPAVQPIYTSVTGKDHYDLETRARSTPALEDAFRAEAFRNLRTQPGVYLHNALESLITQLVDIDSVRIKLFLYLQVLEPKHRGAWYRMGNPQDFFPSGSSREFTLLIRLLTALSAVALVTAAVRGDSALLVPILVSLALVVAHCLTWMDIGYYYAKVPFLFVFAFSILDRLLERGRGGVVPGAILLALVIALSVHLTVWVLF
jgi:4-amino-4-deoxy-L-arabinose transferase-like glycosyltransferase